jgi:hypothetical protein
MQTLDELRLWELRRLVFWTGWQKCQQLKQNNCGQDAIAPVRGRPARI